MLTGKVVIDAFRLTDPRMQAMGHEPRQTTSNLGHLQKPSIQALIHGLGRHYYSLPINYRKNNLEQRVGGSGLFGPSDVPSPSADVAESPQEDVDGWPPTGRL